MFTSMLRSMSRHSILAAAAFGILGAASLAHAQEKSPYSVSMGIDATSHFISYGADVWGGGNEVSPFSSRSTMFGYGTVSASLADNLSVYLNIWSDNNNNVNSAIGGNIQEIDVNTGIKYTYDAFSVTLAHGFWNYAGATEKVIDLTVGYTDGKMITQTDMFSLNPAVNFHYRYDGNGGQDTGLAVVPSISPAITVMKDSQYPLTITVPVAVAFFTNDFQGGDGGYGYFSAGVTVGVPLAFIPAKYGAWTASANLTYYNTPEDSIPNNPEENFVTSTISIGMSF